MPHTNILRLKSVCGRTGLGRSTVYALIKAGRFPACIKLGGGRAAGWIEAEIDAWIEQQLVDSRSPSATGA